MSEYIYYKVGDKRAKVRTDKQAEFESQHPDAKVYYTYQGRNAAVPISGVDAFKEKYGANNVSYAVLDDFKSDSYGKPATQTNSEVTSTEADDRTSVFETIGKGLGAAGVGTAKLALDLGQNLWQQTLGRLDDQTLDETIQNEDNAVTRASMKLGELQERLSREADPTGGQQGFVDLIKQGKIGMAAQKALGSGLESLPMMLAAGTGWGALLYGTAMAAGQYADETRNDDDIPAWKRGVNAIGSAALEMAVEKIGGPLKNLGGKAGKEFSEEMAKEILEDFAKEGTEKVAKRIFDVLKKPLKEGLEEGGEEVLTSFGNDALGSALDMIDGDKDYGIHAQWEQMKEDNPDADLGDFAKSKANEYFDSFLGGALSGMEIAGTTDAIKLGVSKSQKNQVQQAKTMGSSLGLQDMYDVDHQIVDSGNEVEKAFTGKDGKPMLSRDFIDGITSDEAYELSRSEDFSPYQRKALLWHAKSKAIQEGLSEKMDTELNNRISSQNSIINEAQSDGVVVTGFYNNQPVYVKGAVAKNGTVTLEDGSNGPVMIINQMTGEKATVRTEDIKMSDPVNADEYRARIETQLRNNDTHNREIWRNRMSFSAKFRDIQQYAGSKITINASNGLTEVEVLNINPETGKVLIKGKKGDLGQSELQLDADLFYDSIARNEDGTPVYVEKLPQKEQAQEAPVAETTPEPQPEQPVTSEGPQDFREYVGPMVINGVPVNVEVTQQDDTADRVDYTFVDENGVRRSGSTTVAGFAEAVQQTGQLHTEAPVVDTPPTENVPTENVAPEPAPAEVPPTTETPVPQNVTLKPEDIDWDALFDTDQEAFFAEMQNQFGDKSERYFKAFLAAAQKELEKLEKSNPTQLKDIVANEARKDSLQARIDTLNGMISRLTDAPAPEVAPTTPAAPVASAPVQPTTPVQTEGNTPDVSVDKAADARARGFRMTNGQRVDRRGETIGVYGNNTDVTFTADSKGKRTGKVKVIDASSLVPSHIGGVENVEHFLPEAQPKKRTDAASTVSATLIAQNMDNPKMTNVASSAYEGAPIVNKRGEVIQGNNRSASILEMYQTQQQKAAEYKQYLIDHAAEFGLNAEEVAAMQNPVLVRELDVDDADAITLGQYTMQDMESGGSQMIDSGRAIAGLSNKGLLEDFITRLLAEENEETSDMNLSDLITRNGNEALKMLYQNGIINQTQYQSALGANGRITADARAALRGIIEQQLFSGGIDNLSVMFEVLPDKGKKAIMQTIARDLKNPDDAKVTPYLQEAIEVYYQLNQQPDFVAAKTKEEVDNAVELFKGQTSLGENGTPAEKYSNFAFDLAKKFKTLTLKQQRDLLNHLYEVIAGEVNIFGESEGKPLAEAVAEVYGTNLNKGNNETNGQSGAAVLEGGNGGSQEGQQGSTGNVGVRPETGESGQGTTNGGANPTVGGSTQTTGEVTPVAPNPVANPVDAAKAKERHLKNILSRYDITPEHKYDLAVQIGKEIGDFFATYGEYEAFEEIATDFGAEYNKAVKEGVDKSFAERTLNTGNSQENGVTLETEPKQGDNGTETGTETPEDTEGYNGTTGGQRTDDEGGKEGTQETEGLRGGDVNQEIKYPAREGDATRQLLMDTFGFTSVSPGVSQENLNHIYDFLMEMSKMLGISPTSISHGATLGMGVLGEGRIGTLASYQYRASWDGTIKEPYLRFKNSLLSSIAHEWWHSLDQALSYYETGRGKKPSTTASADEFTGRPEVLEAVRDILKAINKSGHKARLESELKYNPEHLSYSKRKKELAARFFEGYIKSKFAEAGIVVNGFSTTQENTPTEEEVKAVIPAFDRLFKVLKEKEGKKEGSTVLYHIGQEVDKIENEKRVSEEAIDLTNSVIDMSLEGVVDVERASDEQTKEVLALGGIENQFSVETDKPIFISNAALAVQVIKMEKATPEQWLKMIEKAGGLKAGEDKWMGLSDWLKASEKKTLTKQEVLDYINDNTIQIEEEQYSESAEDNATIVYGQMRDILQEEFNHYRAEYYEEHEDDDFYGNPAADYAIEKLRNYFGDTQFPYDIEVDNSGDVYFTFYHEDDADMEKWAKKLGVKYEPQNPINSTRQMYTSDGLENKKEIALIVPTIKSWGEWDDVHFGDAGKGRAVAWVRFGDTEIVEDTAESDAILEEISSFTKGVIEKYGKKRSAWPESIQDEYNRLQEKHEKALKITRVLVIDEIQSKRHQEGRDKGYSMSIEEYEQRLNALETERAERLKRRTTLLRQLTEKYGDDFNSYLKLQDTAYVPNENVMTPEEVQEWYATTQDEIDSAIDNLKKEMRTGIPAAPFEKNWHELAMKRMLRYAAENGYDAIAWTKGEQQAERYDIGGAVESIYYVGSFKEGVKDIDINLDTRRGGNIHLQVDNDGKVINEYNDSGDIENSPYIDKNLSEILGKELANKVLSLEEEQSLSGDGLRIGGEGMKGFYDKMLPAFMNKYGKKWGVKVEDINLPDLEKSAQTMHSIPVTDAMKESVMEGQPMFLKTPNGIVYGWTDGKKIYLTKAGMNPNTKIHEYTHLWAKAMMQKNLKGWNSIKQLLKNTPVWNEVMNDVNYSNIHNNEDMVSSEVLSRISGTENAAKLEKMAQQMIDEAKGTMRKAEARGLIQNIKDALNKFWSWVGKNLFEIENFNSIDEITDRVLWDLVNKTDLGELSEGQVETQIVTDPKVIAELEASPKVAGFRNVVQNEDGTFSSPMAYWLQSTKEGAKSRVETAKFELGKWEEAEEHPELVDENGKVTLVKPNKSTVDGVAYDPYIHNRLEPVNLQFKDAWKRDDLVYVETEVAEADLNDGYHADKALLPVGVHSWSNGDVMLSRYDKPIRIMPWEEVADAWANRLNGNGVHFDVVPPAMRSLLVERGVEILPPHKGMGKKCNDAYQAWNAENKKTTLNRNAEPSQSDIPMGGVTSAPKIAPTVIRPRDAEAETNIANVTQKAKHNLAKFRNNDLNFGEIKTLPKMMEKFSEYLGMKYRGRGMYATFNTPSGTVDFRVNDHNAFGDNFEKGNAEHNLSVYVKYYYFENTSNVPYIEFEYLPEDFEAHPEEIFKDLMSGLNMLLNDGFFPMNLKYATMTPHNIDNIDESILFRRSDIQNAAVDYLAGEPRLRAIENAVNEEAAKLGVKVTYKTREQMPKGHKYDKGYYDPKTGEVVICTENASSIADAIQTILHEAVAHKGLRQLMGDKFNEFINRVYNALDAETKAKVDALAAEQYNGNTSVAMEEYMASLAETTDFANNSVWGKIKSIFENIINAILGRNDIKIGDNELRYILRASYNNMTNPRNMETIRGWAQDQMMREELGVGKSITPEMDAEYMAAVEAGDMEKAQRLVLEAAKLAMPNTKVVDENGNPKVVYHQTNAKVYINRETGQNWDKLNWKEKMEWDEREDWDDYWEEQDFNAFSRTNARTTNEFDGFFFAPKYDEYHEYGERTIAAFLDIQNPASKEDYNIDSTHNDAGRKERIRLQEAGFDGVIRMDGKDVDEYIAFEPSQIKSAEAVTYDDAGNVIPLSERFNPDNNDIRYRTGIDPTAVAKETAARTYDKVVNENWQEFQRQFQDAFQPVRIAIDAIQQETGNIPIEDYENYLLIQNQMSSRSRVEIDNFARRYYTPIIKQVNAIIDKIMDMRGLNKRDKKARAEVYKEVRQYLIAKHGLERNKYYQEHKTRTMTAKEMKPLLDEAEKDYQTEVNMININNSLTDAERELQLRDALDVYNATVQEIKTREVPDLRDYSGLTSLFGLESKEWEQAEEMAQELVDEFEKNLGREDNEDGEMVMQSQEIEALWKRINAATDKTLRHSYESGMLSRAQYNEIKEMFKFYIPLRGFDETTAEDVYSYARFEGNRFNAAVHKAEGRTSVADDPIAIIMNMAESEIAQGNKNRAKQALYNYLLNRASAMNDQNSLMQLEDVWYLIDVDEDGNKTYQIVTPDHASGETYEEFENKMQALAEEGRAEKSRKGKLDIGYRFQKQENRNAHYVFVKINGIEKAIYINGDPKAADAINGRYQKELGTGIKLFRDIQRVISSTFTNYSLEFTARNYFRDMIYSHINIGVRESDPAYRKKFRQNWRHNNMGTMMRMLKAYRAGEYDGVALTEDEAAFVEFMANGGQTGYTLINSVENHKKDLQRAIERMQSGIEKGGVKDSTIFKATLGSIELLNEASELVTRFAAYKTSRDMGRGINSSIKDAKEVTVNFNTKGAQDGQGWMGAVARYFGWCKYFFNASVQGVQNLKSMRDANKLKFGTVVGGVVATGFFMPILVSVVSELLGGDDEEEYWNIPEYERQNNFCIPLGNGKYAKVPLPIGFREVYAIGDMVAASLIDKRFNRNAGEVGMDIANKIASIVLPVNPLESMSTGLNMWQTFLYTGLPSSAQVLIQNATNTDWKGTPLQKEYTYNENDPKWMKAFASNPDWMKGLSKWCNEHINLDGDYKGMDWSPEKLENTLSNLGGGIYSLIKKSGKTISMIWNEENRNLSNVPLAGVVLGSGIDSDDRFVTDAYFDMKDFYDANLNYIKRRAEQFGYDLEDVFLKEKGKHQPKMFDIYQNRNFDFMQEWYKGNKELEEMNREIKKLKKEIAAKEKPSTALLNKLAKKQDKFNAERSDFVNDMLELD